MLAVFPFRRSDESKSGKKGSKKRTSPEERKEVVIHIPVPELKPPKLPLGKKPVERSIATVRLPTLLLRVRVDEENLYIDLGYNNATLSTVKISKEEIPLRFKKKSYSFVWVYKSQELTDYYVRGRGYLIRHVLAPPYKVRRMQVQSDIKVFFGRFNGKYPKVRAKGMRLIKEGEIDFEERPAEFLIVVEETVTSFDARSKTPIMYKNVFFRLARIPKKYRPFWEGFDKKGDVDTQFSEFYEGLDTGDGETLEIEANDTGEEEEVGGGFSLFKRLWGRGREEEEEEGEKKEDEEEDYDDLPDIDL